MRHGCRVIALTTGYEVQLFADGRWQTSELLYEKSEALSRAGTLAEDGGAEKVRVLETEPDSSGKSIERTIFEQAVKGKGDKPTTAQQVDSVPMCQAPSDVFRLEARLTLARILRGYLEDENSTASELITDPGKIALLSRHESMLPQAIGVAATVQAQMTEQSQRERTDALYALVDGVKEIATQVSAEAPKLVVALQTKGTQGLFASLKGHPESLRTPLCIAAMAGFLREEGDPAARVEKLLGLVPEEGDLSEPAHGAIDDALAEILDGGDGVKSIIGAMPDLASATKNVCALSRGQFVPRKGAPAVQQGLNTLLRSHPFPAAKASLNRWVSMAMASLQPLTREGGDEERRAFAEVLTAMIQDDGLAGGAKTSEAVTQRARSALVTDPYNQRIEDAIDALLHEIPAKSARVGYLADVSTTETVGERAKSSIVQSLVETMGTVRSLGDLAPPGATRREAEAIQEKLIRKIERAPLPEELRQHLSSKISALPAGGGRPVVGVQNAHRPGDKLRTLTAGEVIFGEGDYGDAAYMVRKGAIEIRITVDGEEIVIATLGPGEIFGEMSLIDDQPRAAAARAKTDAELLVVRGPPFKKRLDALSESDPVLRHLINVYVTRLRMTVKRLS